MARPLPDAGTTYPASRLPALPGIDLGQAPGVSKRAMMGRPNLAMTGSLRLQTQNEPGNQAQMCLVPRT